MIGRKIVLRAPFTILLAVLCALIASPSFGQQGTPPAPGTIIDKSNYKQYAEFFPPEWAKAIEDGYGGLFPEFKMKVVETKHYSLPKVFLDYSAKNAGKYSLDSQGNITPAFNREGLPFPDLKETDKDFVTKLMWNYDSRYFGDDYVDKGGGCFEKRRGEPVRFSLATSFNVFFKNRMELAPKPDMPNPLGLYKAFFFRYLEPESVKNTITLSYRYIDGSKPDDTYLYLPSLRRVIRAESSQRSTPITGSVDALDDFNNFDGRIPDFTYKLVGVQNILAVVDNKLPVEDARATYKKGEVPVNTGGYQLRSMYVIDIIPKSPKYPQSRKRLYLDKETGWSYYAFSYDRADKFWKAWTLTSKMFPMDGGGERAGVSTTLGADVQYGKASGFIQNLVVNKGNLSYDDVTPQALLKIGR